MAHKYVDFSDETDSDWGHYTYGVRWSEADGAFVGTCEDFPVLAWHSANPFNAAGGIMYLVETSTDEERMVPRVECLQ